MRYICLYTVMHLSFLFFAFSKVIVDRCLFHGMFLSVRTSLVFVKFVTDSLSTSILCNTSYIYTGSCFCLSNLSFPDVEFGRVRMCIIARADSTGSLVVHIVHSVNASGISCPATDVTVGSGCIDDNAYEGTGRPQCIAPSLKGVS